MGFAGSMDKLKPELARVEGDARETETATDAEPGAPGEPAAERASAYDHARSGPSGPVENLTTGAAPEGPSYTHRWRTWAPSWVPFATSGTSGPLEAGGDT